MKTPPDRSGITFEVGAQLEARDRQKKWYPATIEKIDYDSERVQVHFRQWSRRHNEWFSWTSPYLRPLERVSLRRQGLKPPSSQPRFVSGSKVLACWTDCRFYPAKILRVNKDDSYTVRFFDGVVRTVKPTKVKPFQKKSRRERSAVGSEGWEEGESGVDEEVRGREEEKKQEEPEEKRGGAGEERGEELPPTSPPVQTATDEGQTTAAQNEPIRADSTQAAPPNPAHIDKDVLLERQAHLPTTHRFSREPLYRVIKNQPPPILSIELDHNPFKCPAPGCSKSFRKAGLLHYHIKYYHAEQQLGQGDEGAERGEGGVRGERFEQQEAPRRKTPSSRGSEVMQERSGEDREQSIMGAGTERLSLKHSHCDAHADHLITLLAELSRKDRKNFLRVKLKKKKKKKKKKRRSHFGLCSSEDELSDRPPITLKLNAELHDVHSHSVHSHGVHSHGVHPHGVHPHSVHSHSVHSHVDDGSDWSTLTAESGEDTPSWPAAMATEECEVVRCVCEVDEENDFMIQCESCLCWQHGTCMGLYEDNVPQHYTCYYCRHTAGWRRAQRVLSEPDWLISGHMFGLSCLKENYSETNASKISHTSSLLAHTHVLNQVLSGLQLKIRMLHSPSHPDLQLWRLPWRQEEGPRLASSPRGETQLCYVSSEHCYQKPGASWEKTEETEDQSEDVHQKPDAVCTDTQEDWFRLKREAEPVGPAGRSESEWRLNLQEHVEVLQQQVCSRMDLIERELDVLESWLDHSGELEPPDPLSRLPQLKQRIRRLLCDLCTVRRLSVWR